MIYPDLNIHQKINAKGNAFTLDPFLSRVGKQVHELPTWYSFKMISRVRKNDGNRYSSDVLLRKEVSREPHGAGREPKY